MVTSAVVEYGIPGKDEVAQAVQSLKRGRAGGPSGMRVEDLKEWLREASREMKSVIHRWRLLVRLTQKTFEDRAVLEELAGQ